MKMIEKVYTKNPSKHNLIAGLNPRGFITKNNYTVYIVFRYRDKDIKIIEENYDQEDYLREGYKIISKISGSKREITLADLILKELIKNNTKINKENYHQRVTRYLETLFFKRKSYKQIKKRYIN